VRLVKPIQQLERAITSSRESTAVSEKSELIDGHRTLLVIIVIG